MHTYATKRAASYYVASLRRSDFEKTDYNKPVKAPLTLVHYGNDCTRCGVKDRVGAYTLIKFLF